MAASPRVDFDKVNLRTYAAKRVVRQFRTASGWLEPGEKAAVLSVADKVRNGAILDIGVGAGRTVPLMLSLSADYRGIDYCPTMVDVARSRCPHVQFLKMDARNLTFGDGIFDLVAFSYNGIDSMDLAGRLEVLRGVHRILRPGGYFVFSALNRRGPAREERWPDLTVFRTAGWSFNRQVRATGRFALGAANWLRLRPCSSQDEDVAIGNLSAHDFGLVALFTSVPAQLRQLGDAGFQVEAIFDPAGEAIALGGSEASKAPWHHFVARLALSAR